MGIQELESNDTVKSISFKGSGGLYMDYFPFIIVKNSGLLHNLTDMYIHDLGRNKKTDPKDLRYQNFPAPSHWITSPKGHYFVDTYNIRSGSVSIRKFDENKTTVDSIARVNHKWTKEGGGLTDEGSTFTWLPKGNFLVSSNDKDELSVYQVTNKSVKQIMQIKDTRYRKVRWASRRLGFSAFNADSSETDFWEFKEKSS